MRREQKVILHGTTAGAYIWEHGMPAELSAGLSGTQIWGFQAPHSRRRNQFLAWTLAVAKSQRRFRRNHCCGSGWSWHSYQIGGSRPVVAGNAPAPVPGRGVGLEVRGSGRTRIRPPTARQQGSGRRSGLLKARPRLVGKRMKQTAICWMGVQQHDELLPTQRESFRAALDDPTAALWRRQPRRLRAAVRPATRVAHGAWRRHPLPRRHAARAASEA